MRAARPLSARRPLPWAWWLPLLALGLVAGQNAGSDMGAAPVSLCAAVATACPALWLRHRRAGSAVALMATAALFGAAQAWWFEAARAARAASFVGGPSELRGRIVGLRAQQARDGARALTLDLRLTSDASSVAAGERVRVTLWRTSRDWQVGELVRGRVGALRVPRGFCNDGSDGYARAMWRQRVLATGSASSDRGWTVLAEAAFASDLSATLQRAREVIARGLARAVADPDARGVLAALVYGDQSGVSVDLRRAYARTGTAHVLSVSGLHIAVVAMSCFALSRRLLAWWPWLALRVQVVRPAALLALAPASLYALLSGGAIATMRSLVMGTLALGGIVLLRRADLWTALAAAALLLCLDDPGAAQDPSFQLSFIAVAGLVGIARRWERWRRTRSTRWLDPLHPAGRWIGSAAGAVVAALAAGLVTGPITAYHFGSVATLGVLANLVVVPVVGSLALLAALVGTALLPLASGLSDLLYVAAAWCVMPANAFVVWLAAKPACALDVALASPLEVACVLVPVAALVAPAGALRRVLIGMSCVLLVVRAGETVAGRVWPQLEVHFLDVGQGDAILTRFPAGAAALLVDGGGLGGALDPGERVILPALRRGGIATLDAIALSHPDFDHYGGLAAVVASVPVQEFWSSGRGSAKARFVALTDVLAVRGVALRKLVAGERALRAGDTVARAVHPAAALRDANDNDASLVLQLVYGSSRVLLSGDVQAPGEAALLRKAPDVASTILKVPHHGSRTSSTRALVARTQPAIAVAQLGMNNRFHFPAQEVRVRWQRAGARWLDTARAGAIVVRSDGQLETVETCRQLETEDGEGSEVAAGISLETDEPTPLALAAASRAS
jgi:competence protein ComEC